MSSMKSRVTTIERSSVPADPAGSGSDRVVIGANAIAVLDGSTERTDDGTVHGSTLADIVADCVRTLDGDTPVGEFLRVATQAVAVQKSAAGVDPAVGACVTAAIVHVGRSELWRIGDPHILVDGVPRPRPPITSPEVALARARAVYLRALLLAGHPIADLRGDDVARRDLEPLRRATVAFRNRCVNGVGYVAIDGQTIPEPFIEVGAARPGTEIVIATDGYFEAGLSLSITEALLQHRLLRDPLLIDDPPATKGWVPGASSFDDRSYVRLRLDVG
jgi:hypothetical protein